MGRPWRPLPACWHIVERAEAALGQSLSHLLLDPDAEALSRTRDAQLAVLLSSLMAWEAVRDRIEVPVAFAGHSLGQVTALVAAGALSVEDGVRLALRRADCTQAAADLRPGRMVALLGVTTEQAELACVGDGDQACWVANDNAPGQVVIGGTAEGVELASRRAEELGVRRVMPLKVAGAFHTPLMATAAEALARDLSGHRFAVPDAPVVCNVDSLAHVDAAWAPRLVQHLVSPVRWRQSMTTMANLGADRFVEVGPGGVLAGLARRCLPDLVTIGIAGPDDLPNSMSAAAAASGRMA